jgi:hypothetical protein
MNAAFPEARLRHPGEFGLLLHLCQSSGPAVRHAAFDALNELQNHLEISPKSEPCPKGRRRGCSPRRPRR